MPWQRRRGSGAARAGGEQRELAEEVAAPQALADLALDALPRTAEVCDIIYIPGETPLLKAARERGARTVNGLGMLLHQGRPAWRSWFDREVEVTAELRKLIEATI